MIKIAILAVITVVISLQFRDKAEYGVYLGIVLCVLIAGYVLDRASIVLDTIDILQRYISIDLVYIKLLLKMIGITYIAEIAASICKDAGYGGVSKQIEIGSKFTILAISVPIMHNLLEVVSKMLG